MEKAKKNKINLFEYHNFFDRDIILSYKGPFHCDVLAVIGKYIDVYFNHNPKASRKMFKIFIELAQNIAEYSAEDSQIKNRTAGIGTIAIGEAEDFYILATGNLVKTNEIGSIIDKYKIINSLNHEDLRKYKIEQRKQANSNIDNSNIGLIQVGLITDQPIESEAIPIDDTHSFFTVSVKINK